MTALIITNSIAAAVVVSCLAVAMRFGHLISGGRFGHGAGRMEVHRSGLAPKGQTELRRAA